MSDELLGGCRALVSVDGESGDLICFLPEGHDGLHYDKLDNVSWKVGKPDE